MMAEALQECLSFSWKKKTLDTEQRETEEDLISSGKWQDHAI